MLTERGVAFVKIDAADIKGELGAQHLEEAADVARRLTERTGDKSDAAFAQASRFLRPPRRVEER